MYEVSVLRISDSDKKINSLTEEQKAQILKKDFSEEILTVEYVNNMYNVVDNIEYYYYVITNKEGDVRMKFADESKKNISQVVGNLLYRLKREILNPMETSLVYSEVLLFGNVSQHELALEVNKTQGAISNKLRLLKLPKYVQVEIFKGNITERHGRAILQMAKSPFFDKIARTLLAKTLEFNWNVSRLENEIDTYLDKPKNEEIRFNVKELKTKRKIKNRKNILSINEIEAGISSSIKRSIKSNEKLIIEDVSGVNGDDYIFLIRLKDVSGDD